MTTTNNTTTTPVYEADHDLIDNAMCEMDKSTLLKNFGALIKTELQKIGHEELLNEYRYKDLSQWVFDHEMESMKEDEYFYVELESRDFSLTSYRDNRSDNPDWEKYPVYAYIHGGVTVSLSPFGDRWDSGQLGCIWASDKDFAERQIKWLDRLLTGDIKYDVVTECYVDLNGKEL